MQGSNAAQTATNLMGTDMSRTEQILRIVLRAVGLIALLAVVPMVMPFEWMVDIHRGLGMGELPDMPIVAYLTRSASALYAVHGTLAVYLSFDVRRYLPVIRVLGLLNTAFGATMLLIDCIVDMPWFWILGEGPFIFVLGVTIVWLTYRIEREQQ